MSQKNEAKYEALTNAAEMIRGHVEVGLTSEQIGGIDIEIYRKACLWVSAMLERKAAKYFKNN